jgi:hypothetical protein
VAHVLPLLSDRLRAEVLPSLRRWLRKELWQAPSPLLDARLRGSDHVTLSEGWEGCEKGLLFIKDVGFTALLDVALRTGTGACVPFVPAAESIVPGDLSAATLNQLSACRNDLWLALETPLHYFPTRTAALVKAMLEVVLRWDASNAGAALLHVLESLPTLGWGVSGVLLEAIAAHSGATRDSGFKAATLLSPAGQQLFCTLLETRLKRAPRLEWRRGALRILGELLAAAVANAGNCGTPSC